MDVIETAIVEDDEESLSLLLTDLKKYQEEHQVVFHVDHFKDGERFLEQYKKESYSLVFMDIELGERHLNGMEVARKLRKLDDQVILVFVTNMKQFVVEGYEVNAFNYILKPVKYYSLALSLDKIVNSLSYTLNSGIVIKSQGSIVKINPKSIYYVDIQKHDIVFHTVNGDIPSYGSLKNIEEELLPYNFFKVNTFALVNLRYVKKLDGFDITLSNGDVIFLSRRRKKEFMQALVSLFGEVM